MSGTSPESPHNLTETAAFVEWEPIPSRHGSDRPVGKETAKRRPLENPMAPGGAPPPPGAGAAAAPRWNARKNSPRKKKGPFHAGATQERAVT